VKPFSTALSTAPTGRSRYVAQAFQLVRLSSSHQRAPSGSSIVIDLVTLVGLGTIFNAGMPKRRKNAEETPSLFPQFRTPWETRGLFSDHFLKTRLHEVSSWPKDDNPIRPIYDFLLDLWHRRHIGFERGNEETTCREFLEPVLNKLGFSCLYKEDLPASSSRMVPDYLLFSDAET